MTARIREALESTLVPPLSIAQIIPATAEEERMKGRVYELEARIETDATMIKTLRTFLEQGRTERDNLYRSKEDDCKTIESLRQQLTQAHSLLSAKPKETIVEVPMKESESVIADQQKYISELERRTKSLDTRCTLLAKDLDESRSSCRFIDTDYKTLNERLKHVTAEKEALSTQLKVQKRLITEQKSRLIDYDRSLEIDSQSRCPTPPMSSRLKPRLPTQPNHLKEESESLKAELKAMSEALKLRNENWENQAKEMERLTDYLCQLEDQLHKKFPVISESTQTDLQSLQPVETLSRHPSLTPPLKRHPHTRHVQKEDENDPLKANHTHESIQTSYTVLSEKHRELLIRFQNLQTSYSLLTCAQAAFTPREQHQAEIHSLSETNMELSTELNRIKILCEKQKQNIYSLEKENDFERSVHESRQSQLNEEIRQIKSRIMEISNPNKHHAHTQSAPITRNLEIQTDPLPNQQPSKSLKCLTLSHAILPEELKGTEAQRILRKLKSVLECPGCGSGSGKLLSLLPCNHPICQSCYSKGLEADPLLIGCECKVCRLPASYALPCAALEKAAQLVKTRNS